jgi:DNA topoisomerase-1
VGFEKKRFVPTETGIKITDFLVKNFPEIFDVKFTVKMEKDLDRIAEENINMQLILNTFYGTFIEKLNSLEKMNNQLSESKEKYLGEDELKNKYYVLKGKYGWVLKKQYLLNSTIQFFPLENEEISIENALIIGNTSQLLGHFKKKPIFLIKGKFGVYIKYNGKNYNTKNIDIKKLDDIKKIIL